MRERIKETGSKQRSAFNLTEAKTLNHLTVRTEILYAELFYRIGSDLNDSSADADLPGFEHFNEVHNVRFVCRGYLGGAFGLLFGLYFCF
ncbi:MAG: hypothetical protein N3A53_06905 [Verrucomicrobiae bacterium]|nr:hypothetical protein [Verrucomicrobiae bacterium]